MGVGALYTVNVFDIKEGFISIVTQMFVQLQFFNIVTTQPSFNLT